MSDAREPGEDAYLLALSVLVPVYGGDTREVQLSAARAGNDVYDLAKEIENCPRDNDTFATRAVAAEHAKPTANDLERARIFASLFFCPGTKENARLTAGYAHDIAEACKEGAREVARRREAEASVQNAITALQHIRALLDAGYYCPKDEVDRALATLRAPVDRQGGLPDE